MTRRILILTAALMLPTLLHAGESALAVRALTFNLRYINPGDTEARTWTARRDQVGQVIRDAKADVIGVQEAFRSMLDDVAERVPGYEEIGVGREDGKTKGEYAAILVRKERFKVLESGTFWLSDTPEIPNSRTWKNRVTRICTWAELQDQATSRVIYVYNTHLDHESQEAREKGVGLILEHVAARTPGTPFIITGDFNAAEDNPAIEKVKASPFHPIDTWRELNPAVPAAESGTMSQFTGARDTAKIDYIFVPAGTRLVDAEIIRTNVDGIYPSDHYPVRASIEFGPVEK
ncbi:MAG: endonuclease/exonuclease/phosphatase family protein [Luteolibacter sp.]|uniref:endonuclease/exonuclease/phosphatase family protein n=1 Tax=Luteolibacter sp. TaxID=1962973 RepID=UPI0032649D51